MSSAEAAIRDLLDRIRTRIDRDGWAVVSTESPEPGHGGAPLAYTVGCSRTPGRPEALVLGLPPYLARYCLD